MHNIWPFGDIWMPRPTSTVVLLVGDTDGFQEVRTGETGQGPGGPSWGVSLFGRKSPGALEQRKLISG